MLIAKEKTSSFRLARRIGLVVFCLALSVELEKIHNVFHVSMLKQYKLDPSHVISLVEIELQPDMPYIKELRNKQISLVKVLWQRQGVEETTWEPEETMRMQY
ncbi:receptor-like protein kinase [Gossypium australe]|uniref:Receptor-like protein kinase n=1 Tax=Gossypium australe TaxID=47621 RepID=A0A5B6WP01_9ROSI|nr:receptor-like protein kinase [Gossypium australe]